VSSVLEVKTDGACTQSLCYSLELRSCVMVNSVLYRELVVEFLVL
jgi:hypothetical protein